MRIKIIAIGILIIFGIVLVVMLSNEPDNDIIIDDDIVTNNYSNEKSKTLTKTEQGKVHIITNNELSILENNQLVTVWEGNGMISPKVFWNDNKFYIVYDKPAGEVFLTDIVVLDSTYNVINYHTITKHVLDFTVQDSIAYILTDKKLRILDLADNNELSTVEFEKSGHDIMVTENYAYVIDDIVTPLYVHIIDISNIHKPIKYTREFDGMNSHLQIQDIANNNWYVLVSSFTMSGHSEWLEAFDVRPENLKNEHASYQLVYENATSYSRFFITDIKIQENFLYATGYSELYHGIKFAIFSLGEDTKQLSMIELDDNDKPISFVLSDKKAYVAGEKTIYVINVDDPSNPIVDRKIEH